MSIRSALEKIENELAGTQARLIAVSKTFPVNAIQEAYDAGQRIFGESKAQEMANKYEALPKDISWHFIGHLQTNKVKYIAGFVQLIHTVDSIKLLQAIDKEAAKHGRIIDVLLQVHIAQEEHKFGLSAAELRALLINPEFKSLKNMRICGLMGMASNTNNISQIDSEFSFLSKLFLELKQEPVNHLDSKIFSELSMGMSGDYPIALKRGATLIRVGSLIFGGRDYASVY